MGPVSYPTTARYRVDLSRPDGKRGGGRPTTAVFRDRHAAEGYLRRIAARSADLIGFRIVDRHTGNTVREGIL